MTLTAVAVDAQEFRIETEVFDGKGEAKANLKSQNLTLFSNGRVYDFSTPDQSKDAGGDPTEIIIHDRLSQTFDLLDVRRQVRTTVTHEELINFVAAIQVEPRLVKKDPFLFAPKFEQTYDEDSQWLTLSSSRLTYRATGAKPSDAAGLNDYQQFADWYVRLNAVRPGAFPPFARLQLNKAIAEFGFVPKEVQLSFKPSALESRIERVSRHYIVWQLSQTDRKRIDSANEMKIRFPKVSLQEYVQPSATASR
jgi:hypothetical protein